MKIIMDGAEVSSVTFSQLPNVLRELEADLVKADRVLNEIRVDGDVYWSVEDALSAITADAREVALQSLTVSEYVTQVCGTAAEYSASVNRALSACADEWKRGGDSPMMLWDESVRGIQWLIDAGNAVAALRPGFAWHRMSENLMRTFQSVEASLLEADLVRAAEVIEKDLCGGIAALGAWFERVSMAA